jgi:thiosulfate/3-mercaptopyruvate sulfurtransferase
MRTSLLTAAILLLPAPAPALQARAATSATPAESLLVSAEWLKARKGDRDLVLLHVGMAHDTARRDFIPGSVAWDYMSFTTSAGGVRTELPPIDSIRSLTEAAGISNSSRVVIYSYDPVMAARAFVTLEVAGHDRLHVLDGGAASWKAGGGAVVATAEPAAARGRFVPRPRTDIVVDADWLRARLDDPAVTLMDTRTIEEYTGTGGRRGIPSAGHLAGARHLVWEEMFRSREDPRLRPREDILAMYRARGAAEGKTVVTYCYIGYRASISYFVARYLGFDAKFYDGSYQDWSLRQLPLVAGEKPR